MPEILTDHSPTALARAIESNGVECCLSWAAWPGMTLCRDRCCDWTITDVPFAFFNNVFRASIPEGEVDGEIQRLQATARQRKVPLFWWTGDSTRPETLPASLERNGFLPVFSAPAMAAPLTTPAAGNRDPEEFRIREVLREEDLDDWLAVMTEVYEFPDFAIAPWRKVLRGQPLGPGSRFRHFVADINGKVVGTASLYFNSGVAGISSVGVLESHRNRGYGTALTRGIMEVAARCGFTIAVLYASPLAAEIYRQLGFRQYGRGQCFLWDPTGTESPTGASESTALPTARRTGEESPRKTPPPE